MDSSRLIRMLLDDGWVLVRTRGSRHRFRHEQKNARVIVVHPKKDMAIGTLRAVLKRAGLLDRLHVVTELDMEFAIAIQKASDNSYDVIVPQYSRRVFGRRHDR
ncbi:hypothetical protein BHUM_01252 [Candidatus Burkholderia humilis]|nr:hypothetical protein BHUM_01252 [Candidatus Burkholderia humilis]